MSAEPECLANGKRFHLEVQGQFRSDAEGTVEVEHHIPLVSGRRGRPDIWIVWQPGDHDGFAAEVFEIKATDWDRMRIGRVRANVLQQARQLWRYMEVALDSRGMTGGATMVFPRAPSDRWRQRVIEALFMERGITVQWWQDGTVTPFEIADVVEEGVEVIDILLGLDMSFYASSDGSVESPPDWLPRLCAAGRSAHARSAMGPIRFGQSEAPAGTKSPSSPPLGQGRPA